MVRRGHGDEEGSHRYRLRQKLASLGDDYWIENGLGSRVFFVDGKAFRVRERLCFQDVQGNEVATIPEKVMHIKDVYSIYRDGHGLATVKKALIAPLRQRFDVHVADGNDLQAQGNIVNHEYEIHDGRNRIVEVSKKWFLVADTYGVSIAPGADDVLLLAITVVIDMMLDEGK